jgi:hypothetical protein
MKRNSFYTLKLSRTAGNQDINLFTNKNTLSGLPTRYEDLFNANKRTSPKAGPQYYLNYSPMANERFMPFVLRAT